MECVIIILPAVLPHGWEEEYSEDGRKYYIK